MMYSEKPKLHARQKLWKPGNLKSISLDVTSKCNMNCPHCYAKTFRDKKLISLDILKKALDEFYDMGVFHYILQGGEAITNIDRLSKIIEMIYSNETYITVASNGWDMTKDMIRWLNYLGVDKISYSLDSGIAKEHDANRGDSSFRRVMQAIDDTFVEGLDVSISLTITRNSLFSPGFNETYRYAIKKKIRIEAQIAEPVGKWDSRKDILLDSDDIKIIKKISNDAPLTYDKRIMVKRDIYRGTEDYCPAGTEFMALSPDGEFLPCNFLQFSLGNIRDKSIKEMRDALLTSKWFKNKYRHCLIGENNEFIDEFVMPYVGQKKPLDAYKLFGLVNNER